MSGFWGRGWFFAELNGSKYAGLVPLSWVIRSARRNGLSPWPWPQRPLTLTLISRATPTIQRPPPTPIAPKARQPIEAELTHWSYSLLLFQCFSRKAFEWLRTDTSWELIERQRQLPRCFEFRLMSVPVWWGSCKRHIWPVPRRWLCWYESVWGGCRGRLWVLPHPAKTIGSFWLFISFPEAEEIRILLPIVELFFPQFAVEIVLVLGLQTTYFRWSCRTLPI